MRTLALSLVVVALAGCASIPKPLQGEVNPITPRQAQQADAVGTAVRWGGRIVSTEPGPNQTCPSFWPSTIRATSCAALPKPCCN